VRINICAADISAAATLVQPTLKLTLVSIDICAANVKVDVSANLFKVDESATLLVFFGFFGFSLSLSFFLSFFPSKTKIVSNFLTVLQILILRVDLDR
jgi:hypothetical protein